MRTLLPDSPTISRVEPLERKGDQQVRAELHEERAHQEKSSICQKLARGRIKL